MKFFANLVLLVLSFPPCAPSAQFDKLSKELIKRKNAEPLDIINDEILKYLFTLAILKIFFYCRKKKSFICFFKFALILVFLVI